MTKTEFVKFANDMARARTGADLGITEESVTRFDDRIVFTVPIPEMGTATLDLERAKVEQMIEGLMAALTKKFEL